MYETNTLQKDIITGSILGKTSTQTD